MADRQKIVAGLMQRQAAEPQQQPGDAAQTPIPPQHNVVHRGGPQEQMRGKPFQKLHDHLSDHGFVHDPGRNQHYNKGTLKHYANPNTGQRAQILDAKDPSQNSLAFHLTKQPKRRTPEQKRRDNFVLYD